ncbi:PhnD/SsuA/transferrin family substrate-binding protein [Marivita sp. S6314]|uniref:phosphate/phosphite/phosphonate ABC transporter substrate-binding protein n=1 Tax=Marivita sp. S6314 TaxID=2926406 RepID=UPI001FF6AAA7|nr:PhnD/SsuA/transferrin family substrate-binding protein [Marivita sp. S6314]MCK0149030.1 PhnD/SsuA/transferrin family substrate-binding protein [Marivita sp. S6314]
MYDRSETAAANDALWAAVAGYLGDAPCHLSRDVPLEGAWTDPDLVLSQTCGLPFSLRLHTQVTLVGAPDFRLPSCPPGFYNSAIIARRDDNRPVEQLLQTPVINDHQSQSGHNALHQFAARSGAPLGTVQISGSHRESTRAVADGHADIAAIDGNSWRMIERWDSWATGLRVLDHTAPTPAMPFICGRNTDAARVFAALKAAISDLSPEQRDTLGLYDLCPATKDAYLAVPNRIP